MIGIYGGTFDPIHFGHINLVTEMMELHHLDEVWFCPVQLSPHKQHRPPIATHHRLEMLRLAVNDLPCCRITDIELNRDGPSYTIHTIEELHKKYPDKQFCLILGEDCLPDFMRWHQPEQIVRKVPLLIGRRYPFPLDLHSFSDNEEIIEALQRGMTPTPIFEISSTDVRKRLAEGLYCGHLVPAKVLDYISSNRLYY